MELQKELPKRKTNRLINYDYSSCGAYFITICTCNRKNYFWKKIPDVLLNINRYYKEAENITNVGATIGRPFKVELSEYGEITDKAINNISEKYPNFSVDSYVIMPNHVHLLISVLIDEKVSSLNVPTVSRVINQFKGYVSKSVGKIIWQKSFYDHIIRSREDYEAYLKYIDENPISWYYDELYEKE